MFRPHFGFADRASRLCCAVFIHCALFACSGQKPADGGSTGGFSGTGPSGGAAGSAPGTGGAATGGSATGGSATGGSATGGSATGGSATGGATTGGTAGSTGATGGAPGGMGGASGGGAGGASGGAGAGGGSSGSAGSGGTGASGFACPSGPFGAPLPANAQAARIDGVPPPGFGQGSSSNVEGPVWLGGSLYVSHIQEGVQAPPPSRMLKITGTTVEQYLLDAGTNGLALDPMGSIVGARHSTGDLATLNLASMTFTPRVTQYMGTRFNSPNDIAIRSDGNIYFTDPSYQAPMPAPQNQTRVYRVDPQGAVTVVDANQNQPNGITLSPDENTLYVATPGNVLRYTVAQDGTVGSGTMMNGVPGSDGMVVDCAGNLYLTDPNQPRVVVVSSAGSMIGTISLGAANGASATNVAFGGADRQTLYITGRGNGAGLWSIDLEVPGYPY